MTPEQLKASILQYAIQGKLVEQRPEEGTGEELYRQIQAEKQRLIHEGKIKKEKPLAEIAEDEIPFDIPGSWKWCRLKSIINAVSARRVHQSDWENSGIPFYRAREIAKLADNGYVDNELYISEELFAEYSQSGVPKSGDLMVTAVGTLGKTYIVRDTDRFYYKDASVICFENFGKACSEYLRYLMMSPYMESVIKGNSTGTTVATITLVRANEYLIPLPPLAEQHRIVAKIEELLPLVDRYAASYEKLEQLNAKFPEDMKKSILQCAIQGKLVEQRPEEGTGEELYRQIQVEKQRLIAEKKIKKEKTLAEISEDEIPFDIPESWKWVRLYNVVYKITDGTHKTPKYVEKGVIFVSAKNLYSGRLCFENCKYITESEHVELYKRCNPACGDLVISKSGSIGTVDVIEANFEFSMFESLALVKFNQHFIDSWYLKYAVQYACYHLNEDNVRGVAVKHLPIVSINSLLIPIPPLAEQKRIVAKIEELLPLCERLK